MYGPVDVIPRNRTCGKKHHPSNPLVRDTDYKAICRLNDPTATLSPLIDALTDPLRGLFQRHRRKSLLNLPVFRLQTCRACLKQMIQPRQFDGLEILVAAVFQSLSNRC